MSTLLYVLQHASSWLWAQHELHHSDEAMNVTTTHRHHWLEIPLQAVFVIAPMDYLIGVPVSIAVAVQLANDTLGPLIHADARCSFGWFTAWLSGPQYHRIHHSDAPQHLDKNFAAIFPVWDRLFGTFYAPQQDEYPQTGLSSGERITTLWQAAIWPFGRWWIMIRASFVRLPTRGAPYRSQL